jgi:hypothetical protein
VAAAAALLLGLMFVESAMGRRMVVKEGVRRRVTAWVAIALPPASLVVAAMAMATRALSSWLGSSRVLLPSSQPFAAAAAAVVVVVVVVVAAVAVAAGTSARASAPWGQMGWSWEQVRSGEARQGGTRRWSRGHCRRGDLQVVMVTWLLVVVAPIGQHLKPS